MAPTRKGQSQRILRVNLQRFFEKLERLGAFVLLQRPNMGHRSHGIVVAAQILRALTARSLDFGAANGRLQRARHLLCYSVLKIKEFIDCAVVTRTPDMRAALGLNKLNGDTQTIAGLLYATLQQVCDTQLLSDFANIGCPPLVCERRTSSDNEKLSNTGERCRYRLDDAVCKVILAGLGGHIVERQHNDRRFVGECESVRPAHRGWT